MIDFLLSMFMVAVIFINFGVAGYAGVNAFSNPDPPSSIMLWGTMVAAWVALGRLALHDLARSIPDDFGEDNDDDFARG